MILAFSAKAGLDDKPFVTAAEKTHYIAGAIGVVDTLKDHLLLCNILCIFYELGEDEYALMLKLLQCFIGDLVCQISNMRKGILFLLRVILDFEQLHSHHLWSASGSRMPAQTDP